MKVNIFALGNTLRNLLGIYLGQEVSEEEYFKIRDGFRELLVKINYQRDKKGGQRNEDI